MSTAIRTALYARLTGDSTLTDLLASTSSVYHRKAPPSAAFPYVIFQRQAERSEWTFQDHHENGVWLVKAVDRSANANDAGAIDARVQSLLNDHALTVTGSSTMSLRRESAVDFDEDHGGETYQHVGSLYRLHTQAT